MWPQIAAAVAPSLISGLFGRNRSNKQTTSTEFDFEQLRESAEAAGFNPLTALRNAGAPTTTTTSVDNGLSTIDFIARGVGDGLAAYAAYDPIVKERQQLEVELMRADLDRINRSPTSFDRYRYGVPQTTSRPGVVTHAAPLTASDLDGTGFAEPPRDNRVVVQGQDQNDLVMSGGVWEVSNTSSSADEVSEQYGEAGEILYGIGRLATDAWSNLRSSHDEFYDDMPTFDWDALEAERASRQPFPAPPLAEQNRRLNQAAEQNGDAIRFTN